MLLSPTTKNAFLVYSFSIPSASLDERNRALAEIQFDSLSWFRSSDTNRPAEAPDVTTIRRLRVCQPDYLDIDVCLLVLSEKLRLK